MDVYRPDALQERVSRRCARKREETRTKFRLPIVFVDHWAARIRVRLLRAGCLALRLSLRVTPVVRMSVAAVPFSRPRLPLPRACRTSFRRARLRNVIVPHLRARLARDGLIFLRHEAAAQLPLPAHTTSVSRTLIAELQIYAISNILPQVELLLRSCFTFGKI